MVSHGDDVAGQGRGYLSGREASKCGWQRVRAVQEMTGPDPA